MKASRSTGKQKSRNPRRQRCCSSIKSQTPAASAAGSSLSGAGSKISSNAFLYLITNDASYCTTAASNFSSGHNIEKAMVYDWCYEQLTPMQKDSFFDSLYGVASGFNPDQQFLHSSVRTQAAPIPFVSLALYGHDNSRAIAALDKAKRAINDPANVYNVVETWNNCCGGAMYAGGYAYDNEFISPLFAVLGWSKGTNENLLDVFNHGKNSAMFYLYEMPPGYTGGYYQVPYHDGWLVYGYTGYSNDILDFGGVTKVIMIHSGAYNDSYSKWFYEKMINSGADDWHGGQQGLKFYDIIFYDKTSDLPAIPPDNLPKSRFFDIGLSFMRSGWNISPSSTDIFASFDISHLVGWHSENNQGHFQIWRGSDRLTFETGFYDMADCNPATTPNQHYQRYYRQTVSANSLLIKMPQQETYNNAGCTSAYGVTYDTVGGQQNERTYYGIYNKNSFVSGGIADRGYLERYEHVENNYTYNYGEFHKAYSSIGNTLGENVKTDQVERAFVYLYPDIFVVFDRVNALDPNFKKTWLLHTIRQPEIDGTFTHGTPFNGAANLPSAPNGGTPGYTSSNTNTITIEEGNSKLFDSIIYPIQRDVTLVGGPNSSGNYNAADSYEFYVGYTCDGCAGFNAAPLARGKIPRDIDGRWRIEVSPQNPSNFDNFLHILYPTSSSGTMFPTSSIESSNGELIGALLEKSDNPWVTMFGKQGEVSGSQTYTFETNLSGIKNMVADLQPNTTYTITVERNGTSTTKTVASSSNGVLYFTT